MTPLHYDGATKRAAILEIARGHVGRMLPPQSVIGAIIDTPQANVARYIEQLREAEALWLRRVFHQGQWRLKVESVA